MQVPMTRVQVIGHKRDLDRTLEVMQSLACVELIDSAQVRGELRPYALAAEQHEMETLSFLQARLDALLAVLPELPDDTPIPWPPAATDPVSTLQAELARYAPEIEKLAAQQEALHSDAQTLPSYAETVRKLVRLTPGLTQLQGYDTIALLVHKRYAQALTLLADQVRAAVGPEFELVSDQVDPDTVGAILVVPQRHAAQVQTLLGNVQVSQVRLPESLRDVSFSDALSRIQRRLDAIPAELAAVETKLREESGQHRPRWLGARRHLAQRLEQLRVRRHLGETDTTFTLIGWVPRPELERVVQTLDDRVPNALDISELPAPEGSTLQPPILLTNRAAVRPYEFFLRLLALPKAGSLDPSTLMALFMPLFFGLMLGDIGYGLVILLIAGLVHFRSKKGTGVRDVTYFLMMGAGWAMIWGLVFGEFFGALGHELGLRPLWRERSDPEALSALLLFAIAIGVVHVTLGLVLGVWEAWRARLRSELWERAGMLLGLCGIFLLVAAASRQLPAGWATPAVAAIVVGLVLLMRGLGPIGVLMAPVELLGGLGNILSYLRLAAIGLASVYLAMVGNELAGRIGVVWVGVLIAALFHALNIAMGAFSPSIHAMRLHYVEFFSKFYEAGGTPFQPFGSLTVDQRTPSTAEALGQPTTPLTGPASPAPSRAGSASS